MCSSTEASQPGQRDVSSHRYIVATSRWSSVGTTVLRFRIQSRKDPVFLEERIGAFLGSFFEQLQAMSDDEFSNRRSGLIAKKREKAKNIGEETGGYWDQIRSGYYDFFQGELPLYELWGMKQWFLHRRD